MLCVSPPVQMLQIGRDPIIAFRGLFMQTEHFMLNQLNILTWQPQIAVRQQALEVRSFSWKCFSLPTPYPSLHPFHSMLSFISYHNKWQREEATCSF